MPGGTQERDEGLRLMELRAVRDVQTRFSGDIELRNVLLIKGLSSIPITPFTSKGAPFLEPWELSQHKW